MKRQPLFNAFTKSYRLRYVVHAYRKTDETKTICGRDVVDASDELFDPDIDGACGKCLKRIEVEDRMHPGYHEKV